VAANVADRLVFLVAQDDEPVLVAEPPLLRLELDGFDVKFLQQRIPQRLIVAEVPPPPRVMVAARNLAA
jgi:hypothetical protein